MLMQVGRARGTSGNTTRFKSGTIQSPACRALRQHIQAPRRRSTQLPSDDSCQLTHRPGLTGSLDVTEFSCHRESSIAPGETLWTGKRQGAGVLMTFPAASSRPRGAFLCGTRPRISINHSSPEEAIKGSGAARTSAQFPQASHKASCCKIQLCTCHLWLLSHSKSSCLHLL